MKVVVVSDTHGSVKAWKEIVRIVGEDSQFLHLGDVLYHGPRNPLPEGYDPKALAEELKNYRIDFVRGNCDADVDVMVLGLPEMPKISEETFGDWKVMMIHGEDLEDEFEFAEFHGVDVLLRGHTHIPKIERKGNVLVINPGSPSLPKGGYPPTFAIVQFSDLLEVQIISLDGSKIMEEVLEK